MKKIKQTLARTQFGKIITQIQKNKMKHPELKTGPNTHYETNEDIVQNFYRKLNTLIGKILVKINTNPNMKQTNQIKFYMCLADYAKLVNGHKHLTTNLKKQWNEFYKGNIAFPLLEQYTNYEQSIQQCEEFFAINDHFLNDEGIPYENKPEQLTEDEKLQTNQIIEQQKDEIKILQNLNQEYLKTIAIYQQEGDKPILQKSQKQPKTTAEFSTPTTKLPTTIEREIFLPSTSKVTPERKTEFHYRNVQNIPKFSGKVIDFQVFYESFMEMVHETNAGDRLKLNILIDKLDDRTAKTISKFSAYHYEKAWQQIQDLYMDSNHFLFNLQEHIQKMVPLKHSSDVQYFYDITNELLAIVNFVEMNKMDPTSEAVLFMEFQEKLPLFLIHKFFELLGKDRPKLAELLTFLQNELDIARREVVSRKKDSIHNKPIAYPKTGFNTQGTLYSRIPFENRPKWNKFMPPPITKVIRQTQPQNYQSKPQHKVFNEIIRPPPNNQQQHFSKAPIKVNNNTHQNQQPHNTIPSLFFNKDISTNEKWEEAKKRNLCVNCLKGNHKKEECWSNRNCWNCNQRHHTTLCKQNVQSYKNIMNVETTNESFEGTKSENQTSTRRYDDDDKDELKTLFEQAEEKYTMNAIANHVSPKFIKSKMMNTTIYGMLDTGANVNLCPMQFITDNNVPTIETKQILKTPNGELETTKTCKIPVTIGKLTKEITFTCYNQHEYFLFGIEMIKEFALYINPKLEVHQKTDSNFQLIETRTKPLCAMMTNTSKISSLITKYPEIFAENSKNIGKIKTEQFNIHLTNEIPINLRPYKCSPEDQERIDAQIKELLDQNIIRPSTSPYSFPVVLVNKKDDGEKSRMCINYIKLNEVTVTECYPMPRIEDIQDLLLNAEFFSVLDLASGFWHIEVNPNDIHKTAFSTNRGHYEWLRMPFGLKNAPIVFQRVVANLISKHNMISFAQNYIDDVIIFSKTIDEHWDHLKKLFEMARKEGMKFKLSKCQFQKTQIKYLGYEISRNSIKPLQSNVEALQKVLAPVDLKTLRGFLGKANYYTKFLPNRAILFYPLYQLLRKNVKWEWTPECQKAFETAKEILTSSPVIGIFDPKKEIVIYTDASNKGIGAVLKQHWKEDPNEETTIAYFSRPLTSYQKNYSTVEQELLAILSAIEFWHYYLIGREFLIKTDHLPLKAVNRFNKPNTRLFNWSMRLMQYQFKVEYKPGKQNEEADYLSRNPVELLNDLTKKQAMWIDKKEIEEAQKKLTNEELPRKVFKFETGNQMELVYICGDKRKIFLPEELARKEIIQLHFEQGHLGKKSIELQFTCKYYVPHLAHMINEIVDSCQTCLQAKQNYQKHGTLGIIGPAETPLEIIHIDTKSGFKGYGSQKDHLHIAIDGMTRFVWYVTSTKKGSNEFIQLIKKVMTIRKPQLIVADNYPAIRGAVFRSFLQNNDIKILFTATNHASSNGMVERVHQTLLEKLKCLTYDQAEKHQTRAWTTNIQKVIESYNNTIHSVTQYSPAYLLTGYDPYELWENEPLEKSRKVAYERSKEKHEKSCTQYDTQRNDPDLQPGDMVYVKTKNKLNRKNLDPPFEGPYEIRRNIGHTTYEVDTGRKIEKIHVSQMKVKRNTNYKPRNITTKWPELLTFITIITISIGLIFGENVQETEYATPFIWKKTEHVPVIGFGYFTHVAIIISPCYWISKQNNTEPIHMAHCLTHFREQVQELISQNCSPDEQIQAQGVVKTHFTKNRKKRIVGAIVGALAGIISYGLLNVGHDYSVVQTQTDITKIEQELTERFQDIQKEFNLQHQYNEKVMNGFNRTWHVLQRLQKQLIDEDIRTEHYIRTIDEISRMGSHLETFFHKMHLGKVDPSYKTLFPGIMKNFTTPLRYWIPHECSYQTNTVTFRFEIPIISPESQVLRLDPFQIVQKIDNKECFMKYSGNYFSLYNIRTKCSRDLHFDPVDPNELVLIDDQQEPCIRHDNKIRHWNAINCEDEINPETTTQIKQDKENLYLYCYKHKLRIEGKNEIDCPNSILTVKKGVTFWIDQRKWPSTYATATTKYAIQSTTNELLGQRTFQLIERQNLAELETILKQEDTSANSLLWKKIANHPYTYISLGSISTIFVLLCLIFLLFKRIWIRNQMRNFRIQVAQNEIPLMRR